MQTNTRSLVLRALALFAIVFALGCGNPQKKIYRPLTQSRSPDSMTNNPIVASNYVFASIEFDDHGELWDRGQFDGVVDQIKGMRRNGDPMTLLIFVHGWKHNASSNSSNLLDFHRYVTNIANTRIADSTNSNHKTVGIYLGWRGDVYNWGKPLFNKLTWAPLQVSFFNRKKVAETVAGVTFTEVVLSLAAHAKMNYKEEPVDSKVLVIGHSFGGLIVERAVSQALIGGFLLNAPVQEAERQDRSLARTNALSNGARRKALEQSLSSYADAANFNSAAEYIEAESAASRSKLEKAESAITDALTEERKAETRLEERTDDFKRRGKEIYDWAKDEPERTVARLLEMLPKASSEQRERVNGIPRPSLPVEFRAGPSVAQLEAFASGLGGASDASAMLLSFDKSSAQEDQNQLEQLSQHLQAHTNRVRIEIANLRRLEEEKRQLEVSLSRTKAEVETLKGAEKIARFEHATRTQTLNERWERASQMRDELRDVVELQSYWERKAEAIAAAGRQSIIDLILLINPASEALTARKMIHALESETLAQYHPPKSQARPLIISISSKADWATQLTFPIGRTLGSWSRHFRYYENDFNPTAKPSKGGGHSLLQPKATPTPRPNGTQFGYFISTAPHNTQLVSHQLVCAHGIDCSDRSTNAVSLSQLLRANLIGDSLGEMEFLTRHGICTLAPKFPAQGDYNKSSYWVIETNERILPGHNDIFTDDFCAIATGLVRISRALEREAAPEEKESAE